VTRVELGRRAESAAADYLFARGFEVLGRNVRLGALELDLVARYGDLVVVAEVRTRGDGARVGPFESVTRAKRARLKRAAERLWREQFAAAKEVKRMRIDVVAITFIAGTTLVEHAEGAVGG
jgi:putative endonuclease